VVAHATDSESCGLHNDEMLSRRKEGESEQAGFAERATLFVEFWIISFSFGTGERLL
jgi:hypothetical protein